MKRWTAATGADRRTPANTVQLGVRRSLEGFWGEKEFRTRVAQLIELDHVTLQIGIRTHKR